jgi:hypothetical protein
VLCIGVDRPLIGKPFGTWAEDARRSGVKLIWCFSTFSHDSEGKVPADILALRKKIPQGEPVIDQHWRFGDAVVQIPGSDLRILPTSGIISHAIFWAIGSQMAE